MNKTQELQEIHMEGDEGDFYFKMPADWSFKDTDVELTEEYGVAMLINTVTNEKYKTRFYT